MTFHPIIQPAQRSIEGPSVFRCSIAALVITAAFAFPLACKVSSFLSLVSSDSGTAQPAPVVLAHEGVGR